ncbi:DEHA2C08250p [Debaryomyces hansenii CBS767]|uniref:DEHA2C08250p n=1 Tax=Debaryomyces hansenii (strain ATCC 36239 / CBS 767 / BCRC 21394 / JCM 1990 / NBRC 0083 / IGC 2968) TaxID=284592 RepID=Q6BUT2_DEBHA|nr:DEHA2C08250p [Debaryomyces hansenii CBS767]CAG86102.2 DEHA2C08250p [Debaryomyces hansenii CBS767]|eukprot:XP_458037.2 DEHA2C08250p [Debaryomyces hansenii CBS767]
MSDLIRKKPPPSIEVNDSIAELDSTIDSYIEKSPLTNKFREENPNLHPVGDGFEDTEDRNISMDSSILESTPEKNPRPSPPALPPRSSSNEEVPPRLPSRSGTIRASINKLSRRRSEGGSEGRGFTLKSFNRLSLNAPRPHSPESSLYKSNEQNSLMSSPHSHSSTSSITSDDDIYTKSDTPFWKYHILKFGKDLYLTTNPGLKHIYCRNGPGYYVEVLYPNKYKYHSSREGFKLIFKDIASKNGDNNPEIMVIIKESLAEGGKYKILIPRSSYLYDGSLTDNESDETESPLFSGVTVPTPIDDKFIPYDQISNVHETVRFKNYEFTDFLNTKWNIGSIPRIKSTRMSKIKSKFNEYKDDPLYKFIGKRYIYFHQNYIEDSPTTYKNESDDPRDIYLHDQGGPHKFPPVLGLFRPNETRTRKKIIKKFNQQANKLDKSRNSQETINNDKINYRLIDNDIAAGSDIRNYFTGGDGLYYSNNPNDDTPDSNKLGWITIYEDTDVFSGSKNKGMFDIVLGLTLAVGFESSLDS